MNNEMQWSSATPGLLIILIDQSGSMLLPYEGTDSRTVVASRAVNRVIDTIIQKNFDGQSPKNRCFISVIGYNAKVENLVSGYLKDLDDNPKRIENVKKKISDGAGGLLEIESKMPVWVDPIDNDTWTNMRGAFMMAKDIVNKWIEDKPQNPAPVIINISDGVPYYDHKPDSVCMQETLAVVKEIQDIDTEDGKIQIFNAMIDDKAERSVFPLSREEVKTEAAQFLYDISTEIPPAYKDAAEKNGLTYVPGSRGMISRAETVDLISLINFGSSKGQRDK